MKNRGLSSAGSVCVQLMLRNSVLRLCDVFVVLVCTWALCVVIQGYRIESAHCVLLRADGVCNGRRSFYTGIRSGNSNVNATNSLYSLL
jgi:hypothetical protein